MAPTLLTRKWLFFSAAAAALALLAIAGAAAAVSVTHVPGFDGPLPFSLETGYVETEAEGAEMFYYFFESERNSGEDPLLLWLTGGPFCSALSTILYENGPLQFDAANYDGDMPKLFYNPNTFTKTSNVIFPDSPVRTGYSYTANDDGAYTTSDTKTAQQVFIFLKRWLEEKHPEFKSNPLYVGGDSYAGIFVPAVALLISNAKEPNGKPSFNLKGYVVGNGLTDTHIDLNSRIPFAHRAGLLSDELYAAAKDSCGENFLQARNAQCSNHLNAAVQCLKDINPEHILEPLCPDSMRIFDGDQTDVGRRSLQSSAVPGLADRRRLRDIRCTTSWHVISDVWANNETVKEALGVRKGTILRWRRCDEPGPDNPRVNYTKDLPSVVEYHRNLTTRGYRALIYSGDHDLVVPTIGTQEWIKFLGFPVTEEWHPWYLDDQVAGYTRTYSNRLTYATVKGGGHDALEYKPKECLAMYERWVSATPL